MITSFRLINKSFFAVLFYVLKSLVRLLFMNNSRIICHPDMTHSSSNLSRSSAPLNEKKEGRICRQTNSRQSYHHE